MACDYVAYCTLCHKEIYKGENLGKAWLESEQHMHEMIKKELITHWTVVGSYAHTGAE